MTLTPKVKVIGQKAGICDGVPSTSALVYFLMLGSCSSSRCHGLVCSLLLWHFLVILTSVLLNLSPWCLMVVQRLFLAVPRGCLQFVIVVFPDHTHLLFCPSFIMSNGLLYVNNKNTTLW